MFSSSYTIQENHNVLSVLCIDKGYKYDDNIICKNKELDKVNHLQVYPDARKWLREWNVEIDTVDPSTLPDATTGLRPNIKFFTTETRIFDANL